MAEKVPVVYDIAQPSPVSLKELSVVAVSLQIWRNEIHKYRTNDTLKTLINPVRVDISSKTVLPDLPSVFYDIIDEYIPRFGRSVYFWLYEHFNRIFVLRGHRDLYSVLKVFDDFVADYNGTIDYVRTAKRMMACDGLDVRAKFVIACTYFFEDDITRIWPSVCNTNSSRISFNDFPQLLYWICRLKNEWDMIPVDEGRSVDEVMLYKFMVGNRPSVEYFMYRLPEEYRMTKAMDIYRSDNQLFITFALSKLNDQKLHEFVNTKGCDLMRDLFRCGGPGHWFVLPTWRYIKNKLNERTFRKLVFMMLELEGAYAFESHSKETPKWWYYCSEIWASIEPNLKQSIVADILSNSRLFENMSIGRSSSRRFVTFLLIILSSATFEQRSTFWRNLWPHLIEGTRSQDLQQIMKLCFVNENEIALFKRNMIAESEIMRNSCVKLLKAGKFDELNDLVDFCWPEVQAAKSYKRQLLPSTLLVETMNYRITSVFKKIKEFGAFIDTIFDSSDQSDDFKNELISSRVPHSLLKSGMFDELNDLVTFCCPEVELARNVKKLLLRLTFLAQDNDLTIIMVKRVKKFNAFIDEAFDDAELSADFKNKIISLPKVQHLLSRCPVLFSCLFPIEALMEFVDTFVLEEQTRQLTKSRMIATLTRDSIESIRRQDNRAFEKPVFSQFLSWLLGSVEEVEKFKQTHFI